MNITIFGSSSVVKNSRAWKIAYESGHLLAQAGFTVVNGGYRGTMEAAAQGAKEAGGKTIGVTTADFPNAVKNSFIDKEICMNHWNKRLFKLIELGDGFLVLNGAMGTLVELVTVCEMLNRQLFEKSIVVLGKQMQSAVRFMRRLPEVSFSKELLFKKDPKSAVQYFESKKGDRFGVKNLSPF
ncbi:MAG: LOG family protein [Candidatus Omnitrophica bacterium]|nr:LOG family protein [Candidatus Omnitrophota bacterium]